MAKPRTFVEPGGIAEIRDEVNFHGDHGTLGRASSWPNLQPAR
jgi:hypothetical protein